MCVDRAASELPVSTGANLDWLSLDALEAGTPAVHDLSRSDKVALLAGHAGANHGDLTGQISSSPPHGGVITSLRLVDELRPDFLEDTHVPLGVHTNVDLVSHGKVNLRLEQKLALLVPFTSDLQTQLV